MQNQWPAVPNNSARMIAGRYRLGRSLGEGAVGEVFYAEDTKFDPPRIVALKLIHPELLLDPQVREDIKKEASTTALFSHPNILRVLDFEIEADHAYIVTEYAGGGSLYAKLYLSPDLPPEPLAPKEVAKYLEQIAAALDKAHAQGLIHRDIKLANILLDNDDRPLLADFGLALPVRGRRLAKTEAWGTAAYAAPEIWKGQAGVASDIYALGVVVYELLTGRTPFQKDSQELEWHHKNSPVPPLGKYMPELENAPELDKALAAALAKEPGKRPKTASNFARRFKTATNSLPAVKPLPKTDTVTVPASYIKAGKPTQTKLSSKGLAFLILALFFGFPFGFFVITAVFSGAKFSSKSSTAITATPTPPRRPATPTLAPTAVSSAPPITLAAHTGRVLSLDWSPDGKLLASAAADGTVRLWKPDGTPLTPLIGHSLDVQNVSWSPDGKIIATAGVDATVRLWKPDATLIATLSGHLAPVRSVHWSPDGKILASVADDFTVRLWQSDGTLIAALSGHTRFIEGLSWSPDSQTLATVSEDKTLRLWKSDGRLLNNITDSPTALSDVSWSPDGKFLAASSTDGTLRLWDNNIMLINTIRSDGGKIYSLAWSPDSKILASGSGDKKVRLWNTNGSLRQVFTGHTDYVWGLDWSPDGTRLASGAAEIRVWSLDGKSQNTFSNNIRQIFSFGWSPDGKTLATAMGDITVQLWTI